MSSPRTAMIVAGGAGTRLAPLTDDLPKPLLPLVGMPFLAGLIARLHGFGVDRILIVAGADPAPFAALGRWALDLGVEVEVVPEPQPLDTAGGVRSALDRVDRTFLVLNGDVLMDLDVPALFAHHDREDAMATLALTRVEDTSSFGVCVLEGRRIVDFVEKPAPGQLPGQDTVNAGAYVLEPAALSSFAAGPLSFERQVFPELVAAGHKLAGFVSDGVWADLGTPQRYLGGHRLVLDGKVPWPTVTSGVAGRVDAAAYVSTEATLQPPYWIGAMSRVALRSELGPYVVLGEQVRVEAGAHVADAVLHDGVLVEEGAVVTGAVLGAGARIGAGSQVRGEVAAGELIRGATSPADTQRGEPVVVGPGAVVPAGTVVPAGSRIAQVAR